MVEVVPFKQNIKNIEVLLITDDAESSPTKGGLLNLTAQDVLDMTDPNNHTLTVLGNPGDVVNLGIGASAWNKAALDANGFQTYSQTFNGINLMLKVEHTLSSIKSSREAVEAVATGTLVSFCADQPGIFSLSTVTAGCRRI